MNKQKNEKIVEMKVVEWLDDAAANMEFLKREISVNGLTPKANDIKHRITSKFELVDQLMAIETARRVHEGLKNTT